MNILKSLRISSGIKQKDLAEMLVLHSQLITITNPAEADQMLIHSENSRIFTMFL